jgi:ankyrin repeat protein
MEEAMKKVLKAVILLVMALSLSLLAAGQAASSVDAQLLEAARIGDTAAVQQLLQKGANIEAKDKYGRTPLMVADIYDNTNVMKLLLDKGANIEAKDKYDKTPLIAAATYGKVEVVKLLLDKGANIAAEHDGETSLILAANEGKVEVVKLLLDRGDNIEAKATAFPYDGDTALIRASYQGRSEMVKLLLDRGANIEARNKNGNTALITAAENGHTEIVKLLLDKGANIEAKNNYDRTALLWAAAQNKTEIAKVLLNKGANTEAKNSRGVTALHEAVENDNAEMVKLLLEKGANVDASNNQGRTALAVATSRGRPEVVRLLEQHGSQNPLAPYVIALQNAPYDEAQRHKILKASTGLPTPPAIPEEARQLFLQASALIKQTSTAQELQKPIELLGKALIIAPWWGNAYYNLSRAQELSGDYDEAVKQLNYYLELKLTEADASEARAHISVIQAEKEAAAQKKHQNESILAVKYVSGGVTRLRYYDAPAWWSGELGIDGLYTYRVPEEIPFYANVFRMPNGRYLAITLNAQSNNGVYAGDKVSVIDITDKSCMQGRDFAFGELHYTEPCGAHYDVNVSNQPNATATVTYPATGASVTLPIALLYRARAFKSGVNSDGTAYEGGSAIKVLHFERSVVIAAEDPNVNAMGLTPTTVTPYQPDKK